MKTENAMKTLNAARRAIGLSAQGIGCSQTVIVNALRQLERDVGVETVPQTVQVLKGMLGNKGLVSEKVAMASMEEINSLREHIRPRPQHLSDDELDAEQQDPETNEPTQRPH
jgi:peptide deformylase